MWRCSGERPWSTLLLSIDSVSVSRTTTDVRAQIWLPLKIWTGTLARSDVKVKASGELKEWDVPTMASVQLCHFSDLGKTIARALCLSHWWFSETCHCKRVDPSWSLISLVRQCWKWLEQHLSKRQTCGRDILGGALSSLEGWRRSLPPSTLPTPGIFFTG